MVERRFVGINVEELGERGLDQGFPIVFQRKIFQPPLRRQQSVVK